MVKSYLGVYIFVEDESVHITSVEGPASPTVNKKEDRGTQYFKGAILHNNIGINRPLDLRLQYLKIIHVLQYIQLPH